MENTFFETPQYPVLEKFKRSLVLFVTYSLALLATLLFIKVLEYVYFTFKGQIPDGFFWVFLNSLFFDVVFFLKYLPILYLVYLLFYFSIKRKENAIYVAGIIFSVYVLIYLLLLKYYFTALVPLGEDLYGYSLTDIKKTISASTDIDILSIIITILPFVFLWLALFKIKKFSTINLRISAIIMAFSLILLYFNIKTIPNQTNFKSDFAYNLSINKEAYFFQKSYIYFFDNEPNIDIYAANYFEEESVSKNNPSTDFKYINSSYPFLREENADDVLTNFFNIDSTKSPNIVFIQIEGLGRAFSGPNAYLGSFTPFLDQLRTKSLYFENFLAAQGRTFASLPSILGSLPFFEKGYNDLGSNMPPAFTAFNILERNGYHSSFFIATDLEFDNEGKFIRSQGVKNITSKVNFGNYPASHNTYWGYPDMDLMDKSLGYFNQQSAPFISYIQTISMHTPYKVPEMDKYYQLFENQMNKLGLNESQKNDRRANKDQFASVLYTDEALKFFFDQFSKLPIYNNTIFIITGDHRLPEIPMSTKIDRYHVPLIVYSPLLKRTASFKSISSHLDITPSLMKFMANNYQLKIPNQVAWVGSGLDTVKKFRNIHRYPLKQTVSNLIDFVSGEYFLNENTLFTLNDTFNIQAIEDESRKNQLISEFNQYKSQNNQIIKSRKLIPDTVFRAFFINK